MKVVYVITRSDVLGGASIHVLDLVRGMTRLGLEVVILVGGSGAFTDQLEKWGIRYRSLTYLVRPLSPTNDFRAVIELRRILAEECPDVVHLHSSKAGTIGRIAAKSLGVPVIFTAHGWAFTEGVPVLKRLLYWGIEFITAPLATRIITVSEFDSRLARRLRVGSRAKLQTIHNAVPDSFSLPIVARALQDPVRLIMVARFDTPKDQASLLRALAADDSLNWELDLIGDGPSLQASKSLAASLGIDRCVRFLGNCRNVPELLAAADIFVLISHWEGLPLSILEAMRAALPVVSTRVGGVPELVTDELTGLLIPPGDQSAIASALKKLIECPALRRQMGHAGRLRYEKHFQLERMLAETLAVYRDVCVPCDESEDQRGS